MVGNHYALIHVWTYLMEVEHLNRRGLVLYAIQIEIIKGVIYIAPMEHMFEL